MPVLSRGTAVVAIVACAATASGCPGPNQDAERPAGERPPPGETCTVFLTFDDGPRYGTDDCLDVLREKEVRGTFFVCGFNFRSDMGAGRVRWNESVARRIPAEGHLTGNHSYSHEYAYGRVDAFLADMQRNVDELTRVHGGTAPSAIGRFARLPGRNSWRLGRDDPRNGNDPMAGDEAAVADRLQSDGYRVFGWDDEWHFVQDGANRDPREAPEEVVERVRRLCAGERRPRTPGRVIVLTHDDMFRESRGNRQQLAAFVQGLKDLGYAFDTVDNY